MKPESLPQLAIVGRRVLTPDGVRPAAILIKSGIIREIVEPAAVPAGFVSRDYGNLVVMPGLIDPHVHINEPGRTDWEGFVTATRAAAAGGVTTLVDMPLNCTPVTVSVEALEVKRSVAAGRLFADCGFYGGLIPGSEDEIQPLIDRGVFGIKTFLIDSGIADFPPVDSGTLGRGMSVIANSSIPLLAHAEIRKPGVDDPVDSDWTRYGTFLSSRPASWEAAAIALLLELGLRYGCRVHIVHLSDAGSIGAITAARRDGLALSVETCPHYLYFDAESIRPGQTLLKCAPPIRSRANNDRLLNALLDGTIDFVASDHSPTLPAAKAIDSGDFQKAWGGIASLQLRLPVMWTLTRTRGATISDLSRWLTGHPARFLGLNSRKGRIHPGYDADLVVWDPESDFTVVPDALYDRHKLTPYEGLRLSGAVRATYLHGTLIFEEGRFGMPAGRILDRPS